jgi:hypothetical protein
MALEVVREDDGFDLPKLGVEDGTTFGFFDRWTLGMSPDGKNVVDMADWAARDMHEFLTKDYKGRQIENVLTLPLISSEWTIVAAKGDKGEAEWLKSYWDADVYSGGCRTSLDQIISLMTSAFYYRRAYFEKVWKKGTGDFEGKIVYEDLAWRPQTTCRLMRDPYTGRFRGFEQEPYYLGGAIKVNPDKWPIQIQPNRAFVYTHGTRRDPLNGTSDLEVAFWAWKTKQKLLMLWFQFLQSVSLPRVIVKAQDQGTASSVAKEISRMKSSGVLPVSTPGGPDSVSIDSLDISGKGAEQFLEAIRWLDQAATQSVLAGFLDLTAAGANGAGSYALSKDASSFFLQSLEAKAREMEDQIRQSLFAPLIRHNFGPGASIPKLAFEPLQDIDKATAVDLLKTAFSAPPGGPVPTTFIAGLAEQVANYLGMDGEQARDDFKKSFDAAAAQAAMQAQQTPGGGSPVAQQIAGVAGATKAASEALKAGLSPADAYKQSREDDAGHAKRTAEAETEAKKRQAAQEKMARAAVKAKTGRTHNDIVGK